jgi:hypothetical protein
MWVGGARFIIVPLVVSCRLRHELVRDHGKLVISIERGGCNHHAAWSTKLVRFGNCQCLIGLLETDYGPDWMSCSGNNDEKLKQRGNKAKGVPTKNQSCVELCTFP